MYYDLLAARTKEKLTNVAIVRVEQLTPFPFQRVVEEAYKYGKNVSDVGVGVCVCVRMCVLVSVYMCVMHTLLDQDVLTRVRTCVFS